MPTNEERKKARIVKQTADKMRADLERSLKREMTARRIRDWSGMIDAVGDRDDFRAIVIGQAFIENAMVLLVEQYLHHPEKLNFATMGFGAKLALAEAFGEVQESESGAYKKLAELRNRLAHGVGEKLHPEDAKALLQALRSANVREHIDTMSEYVDETVRERDARNWDGLGKATLQPPLLKHQVEIRAVMVLLQMLLKIALDGPRRQHPLDGYTQGLAQIIMGQTSTG